MNADAPPLGWLGRRAFLTRAGSGLGYVALSALLNPRLFAQSRTDTAGTNWPGVIRPLHHAAKAKRVIYLYMAGGPSHLETFDPKPELGRLHAQPIPASILHGQSVSPNGRSTNLCVGPQFPFVHCGRASMPMTTLFPHLAKVADDLCLIRSMKTDSFVHDLAHTLMSTGSLLTGRPCLGSWLWYGLGSECDNLPGFVVLRAGTGSHPLTAEMWGNGFLPTRFQGVHFRSRGDAVHYLGNLPGVTRDGQQAIVRSVQQLDQLSPHAIDDPEVATHIAQYETAFSMQMSVPELVDLSTESKETLNLYGVPGFDGSFAANCLLARRMAERGVRIVQIIHLDWDHHYQLKDSMPGTAAQVDQGIAALLIDLKRRGLLDDTLVVWGGEFGRTPVAQVFNNSPGRDHHNKCFCMWLAGAGVKAGFIHGATDDFGFNIVEDPVHVHDLHATILHLLGIDHEQLTFRSQGRDYRLTDVSGEVVEQLLA
jgi:hypothetical protein